MSNKQALKNKDLNRTLLLTPEVGRKSERKGSSRKENRRRASQTENNNLLKLEQEDVNTENENAQKRPISRENRAQKKFSHSVYNKAAIMLDHLNDGKGKPTTTETLEFESEFEKRRSYSLAFAAKRYEAILKDVLLDSSFYSSYFKLETFHHTKVMVMLLDFYEHNFQFSESTRETVEVDSSSHLDHIHEIQTAFFKHKVKLCSAFARNRIKVCALTLDAMLPDEVKERGECGSRHFLCAWVNPFVSSISAVLDQLEEEKFSVQDNLLEEQEDGEFVYCIDEIFEDLLVFPASKKDDVYNSDLVANYSLIPQSRPRYLMAEIARKVLNDICLGQQRSSELIQGIKLDGFVVEGCGVVLTHPETGSLAAHICSHINKNKRLYIFGCLGNKKVEVERNLRKMGVNKYDYELIPEPFNSILSNDERLKSVKVIFCNPPCSKSGVVNPVDFILQEGSEAALSLSKVVTKSQIKGFVGEQAATLRTAFTFSLVQSVIYATFSTHSEENESLVKRVIEEQEESKNNFDIAPVLQDVTNYEEAENKIGTKHLKSSPTNMTDGFFVTLLSRKIKEDSVRDIMDRAAKKGLLKKTAKANKKTKTAVNQKLLSPQQPPHVAERMSRSPKPSPKSGKKKKQPVVKLDVEEEEVHSDEKEKRFKF